ncbi:glycosyltransferase family protein [Neotamlana laminarinivorans]|uniref:Glycosyltransferase involved in cell wall biosynthesis n=1 Tax=Neotamlana laminarinivorans TaxID=2883124 RepID=A0A9X1I046_9FLAO|nr:hypothetical protein [Tamlana laminarinivorans]MCB4799000.1 hypothetical protein [Tamlana laminarinivorans]
MKITFICGSLEPGKDGVGDYTRRLCAELCNKEVEVSLLAFSDKHCNTVISEDLIINEFKVSCLRLPFALSIKERTKMAQSFVIKVNPNWVSLQFVPYAFHNKGLPFGLGKALKSVIGERNLHVMVHELWIGMSYQSPKKEKIVGKLQKLLIGLIFKKLNPKLINTQTNLYKHHLKNMGFKASVLPLFSNIPKQSGFSGLEIPESKIEGNYFVIFGSIHQHAPIEKFMEELSGIYQDKAISFVALGRNGSALNYWSDVINKHGFKLSVLGPQSEIAISYVLSKAKYGLATTPFTLIEKSGSVAAMRDHGLPVICLSKPWSAIGYSNQEQVHGVVEYSSGQLKNCFIQSNLETAPNINATSIALSFINKIENYG